MTDTVSEIRDAKAAALEMAALDTGVKNSALNAMAEALEANRSVILEANAEDVRDSEGKVPAEILSRLRLSDSKISDMVFSLKDVAALPDPVGETMSATELDENLPAPDAFSDGSVLDAIRTLPENYRNAIYLHYYEGYTAAEIGRMMAVPTNTVLSWLRRARAQLHTMLKEEIEDEVG